MKYLCLVDADEALHPVRSATTVRVRGGRVAIAVADRVPAVRVGSVEVRPVRELGAGAGTA